MLEEPNRLKIRVVARAANPRAVPQLRPIEQFWAPLKPKVYEGDWEAENSHHLRARILLKLESFMPEVCQKLVAHVKTNERRVADCGHYTLLRLWTPNKNRRLIPSTRL